jgi:type II secretory pathway pseudopilin PulG
MIFVVGEETKVGSNRRNLFRAGFTAIEMMVVVSIIIVLVAMVVPTIGPAMKKGSVNDAASAIQRACSMARQLARSTTQPRGTPTDPLKWYGVAVVVPPESEKKPAYAVVVYGGNPIDYSLASNEANQYPNSTPKLDGSNSFYSGIKPAGKFTFSRSVMPMKDDTVSATATPTYSFMDPNTAVGWYYQYRTGFVFQNTATPPSSGVDIGVPPSGPGSTGSPQAFGVASLDMKYRVAVAIYKIGLLNAQDVN